MRVADPFAWAVRICLSLGVVSLAGANASRLHRFTGIVVNDIDPCIPVAEAVHPAETLGHAVKRSEITHEVVRRDVDADFAGRSANEKDGAVLRCHSPLGLGHEAGEDSVCLRQSVPLQPAQGPGESLDGQPRFAELVRNLLHIVQLAEEDQDRLKTVLVFQGASGDLIRSLRLVNGTESYPLLRLDALSYLGVFAVCVSEPTFLIVAAAARCRS